MISPDTLVWLGIVFCISQSAMFSGLNLAFFSLSRLRLQIEADHGSAAAEEVIRLRSDSNFLLTTILWGNVGINVLLTLLSDSVLFGVYSFMFSTIVITLIGEITPQAYFSRHALQMAALLSPAIKFYQVLLYVVAKPSALLLDAWLGKEGIGYLAESELRTMIQQHMDAEGADVDHVEGIGALNFLDIDELHVTEEGELIHPESIISLPLRLDLPIFPEITRSTEDPFLNRLHESRHGWVVITDDNNWPRLVVDADGCLRSALFDSGDFDIYAFCHRPVVVTDESTPLGDALWKIKESDYIDDQDDSTIENDVLLVWGQHPRIITGADIFARLLQGIVPPENIEVVIPGLTPKPEDKNTSEGAE